MAAVTERFALIQSGSRRKAAFFFGARPQLTLATSQGLFKDNTDSIHGVHGDAQKGMVQMIQAVKSLDGGGHWIPYADLTGKPPKGGFLFFVHGPWLTLAHLLKPLAGIDAVAWSDSVPLYGAAPLSQARSFPRLIAVRSVKCAVRRSGQIL